MGIGISFSEKCSSSSTHSIFDGKFFSPVKDWEGQNGREHCCPHLVDVEEGKHEKYGDHYDDYDEFGDFGAHDYDEDGNELQDLPLE